MLMLSDELRNENSQIHTCNAAGLALKNALSARDSTRQDEYSARWMALDVDARQKIKEASLLTLASPQPRAGAVAAQVVSAIAAVELPVGQWPDLVEILLGFINTSDDTNLKIATLQAIGYICETIVLALRLNEILTAVIHGARKEESSSEVQLAAVHALFDSLEFVLQDPTHCSDSPSELLYQVGAFECLVKIMALYYDKMAFYMEQALFGLTVMGMKHSDERVALQAIEFWTTVCEEEIELAHEARESKHFAKVALPEVIPVLLNLLLGTLGADPFPCSNTDEGEWNLAMSTGTCLNYMAQAVADAIVPAVIPFIEAHIKAQDWHQRKAAIMLFGSILEGPDPQVLTPLVNQALPLLIGIMNDENLHPDVHLHPLIPALVNGLSDRPAHLSTLLWVTETSVLFTFLLVHVTFTITSYVSHSTTDCIPVMQNTVIAILQRMEQLLNMQNQIISVDDRNNWNELQSNLCSVVIICHHSVIRRLSRGIQPMADQIMTLVLQLIQGAGKTSTVLEDAFLVVGSLAAALEAGFTPYIQAFLPFLYPALKAHENTQLCMVAVGIIRDIPRALGDQSAQYAGAFMNVSLENLQSNISILSCFGDIALAIGPAFDSYLNTTMDVLRQAGSVQPNPLDFDLMDYVAQLREGILEAYTGVVTGFKNTEKISSSSVHQCLADEERSDSIVKLSFGLIGDLADCFPNGQIKEHLLEEWIAHEFCSKRRLASCASAGSVEFIPVPAVSGYMTGSVINIVAGQVPALMGITGFR
ncbi:karyopherin Kap95 [Suillus fuscotomentosus]|uniref:Karyopherin Kap95 n=1 Tax=Suillus fuscotomentosus TaxID=1912939 RepID=A0AAD4E068_9AGAM|nr:karyopherin Kap95 [Suillus fuscotomentosus]KAG1897338.1 karyopherin Kap95 [Suillus fuscotomentosus]